MYGRILTGNRRTQDCVSSAEMDGAPDREDDAVFEGEQHRFEIWCKRNCRLGSPEIDGEGGLDCSLDRCCRCR